MKMVGILRINPSPIGILLKGGLVARETPFNFNSTSYTHKFRNPLALTGAIASFFGDIGFAQN